METNLNDINAKLVDISTQYSRFAANQVLTETQLNSFLDYFDDQDRLTRTSLSGVGIVCGFNVIYDSTNKTIEVSQGRGVTTDGDLVALLTKSETPEALEDTTLKSIRLDSNIYTRFKLFADDYSQYPRFKKNGTTITLYELFEEEADSATPLSEFPVDLSNMVVLLYLESYEKSGDLCTQLTCDNQGLEQVSRLRVLLVSKTNAEYISDKDQIYKEHDWYETYLNLPEVSAKRVILKKENTETYGQLRLSYRTAINDDNVVTNLRNGFNDILRKLNQNEIPLNAFDRIFDFSSNSIPRDFQYRYDILKDLIDTYNEIKELLLELKAECSPKIFSFPKHLLLGRLVEVKPYKSLRHEFYKSPIIGDDAQNHKKVLSLLGRAMVMLRNLYEGNKGDEIRITPSLSLDTLSNKAIPYYYSIDNPLLKYWDFFKTKRFKELFNLSYHQQKKAGVPKTVENPLGYNIDGYDFYRIEGHQGKHYRDALETIQKLKTDNGLSFDVKVLSIDVNKSTIKMKDYKCHFEDLQVLLQAWKAEQDCVLAEVSRFISAFSIEEPGKNWAASDDGHDKNVKDMTKEELEALEKKREESEAITSHVSSVKADEYYSPMGYGTMAVADTKGDEVLVNSLRAMGHSEERIHRMMLDREQRNQTNVVEATLYKGQGTLADAMGTILQGHPGIGKDELKMRMKAAMLEQARKEAWLNNQNMSEFVLTNASEILVDVYVLDNEIPKDITDLNLDNIADYTATIESLCQRVKTLQADFDSVQLQQGIKQIVALLINQLSGICCSGKKLQILYKEIETRKADILLQKQLCEFIKKHPGLEHRAGVVPGGTFVMVYLRDDEEQDAETGPARLLVPFRGQPAQGSGGFIQLLNEEYKLPFVFSQEQEMLGRVNQYFEIVPIGKSVAETVDNLANYLNQLWRLTQMSKRIKANAKGATLIVEMVADVEQASQSFAFFDDADAIGGVEQPIKFQTDLEKGLTLTEKSTVIADFSLPYMCCSDCSPINFIIPKEPVFLSLPESYVCLKDGETPTPLPFTVSPEDGEIKAIVPAGVPSGLTKDANDKPVFDPSLTHESLYGKPIEFTVDDDPTDCVITVYADVELSVVTYVEYNNLKTIATVTYEVSNVYQNLTYTWYFGFGTTEVEMPGADGKIVKTYELPFNEENRIEPKLNVTNGVCEKDVLIEPIQFEDNVDVTLDIVDTYCLNPIATGEVFVQFTNKNPQDGIIEIVGEYQGLRIDGNSLAIDPASFQDFDQEISFTLSGLPTTATISIGKPLSVAIMFNAGEYITENGVLKQRFYLDAYLQDMADPAQLSFEWTYDNNVFGTTQNAEIALPVSAATGGNYLIGLRVIPENGCESQASETLQTEYPNFDVGMTQTEFCLDDTQYYDIMVYPQIQGLQLTGPGVSYSNGVYRFQPSDSGLTTAGTVDFTVNGTVIFTVTLKDKTQASFTYQVTETHLILNNTSSDTANEFIYEVDTLDPISRNNRIQVKIDKTTITKDWINIKLIAISDCGRTEFTEQEIQIRDDSNPATDCVETTLALIKADEKRLPKDVDVSSDYMNKIIMPTQTFYGTIIAAPPAVLSSGNFSGVQGFEALFIDTAEAIVKNAGNSYSRDIFSRYFIAQIKLYLNLLHCQPHSDLKDAALSITDMLRILSGLLSTLKQRDIKFDESDELKIFLNAYSNDPQVVDFLKTAINDLLLNEIL